MRQLSSPNRPEGTPSRAYEVQLHLASRECTATQRADWDWLWRRLLGPGAEAGTAAERETTTARESAPAGETTQETLGSQEERSRP